MEDYENRIVNRLLEYSDPWDEATEDEVKDAINNSPIHVIEWLLDLLDNYTVEV